MRQSPGSSRLHGYRPSVTLSLILATTLVLLPVLSVSAASVRAAAGGRKSEPARRESALSPSPAAAPLVAPSLSVTKVDSFADPDGDGKAEPGDTITYTVTVTNNGTDATNVQLNDTIDANTTLVPGSVATQPIAADDSYSVLGNVRIQPSAAAGLLANDCDPDNGGVCSSAGLTASGPATSAQGGNVSVNANGSFSYNPPPGYEGPDSFTYTVTDPTGKTDTATASFTVSDVVWFIDNAAAAGGDGRLTNPYNSLASVSNGGDLDEPFDVIFVHEGNAPYGGGIVLENNQRLVGQGTSLDAALATFGITVPLHSDARPAATSAPTLSNAAGDVITLANSNAVYYVNPAASAAGSSAVAGSGVGGNALVNVGASAGGSANGVSLSNLSGGFTMTGGTVAGNSSGTAVSVSGGAASVSFNGVSISQNGGRVVDVQNRTGGAVSFNAATGVAGTNGTTDAVSLLSNTGGLVTFAGPVTVSTVGSGARGLVADSGTVNLTNGGNAISSTGAAAVDLENLTVNISVATTFSTNSTGRGLRVDNVSGSANFGNTTVTNSANTGVLLTDNSASISFAALDIAPATNVRALHATNNTGALTSTSGTITTTGAAAVEIAGTSTASRTPLNLQLTSVSSSGGTNGVILSNTSATSSPGGFNVNGNTSGACGGVANPGSPSGTAPDTADCSGGRIQSSTGSTGTNDGVGVLLIDVEKVSLTRVRVDGHTNFGVKGTNVAGFKLDAAYLHNNGDDTSGEGEGNVYLTGLTGGAGLNSITNSFLDLGAYRNLYLLNTSGVLDRLTVSGTTIGNDGTNGSDGIFVQADNSANVGVPVTLKVTVQNGRFLGSRGDGTQMSVRGTSTADMTFTGNRMTNNHPNQVSGSTAVIITSAGASSATYNPTVTYNISNNVINNNSPNNASGPAIAVGKGGVSADASFVGTISGNQIGTAGVANSGSAQGSGIVVDIVGGGVHNSTITNNVIRQFTNNGILAQAGGKTAGGGTGNLILDIRGNTVAEPSANSVALSFPTNGIRVVAGTNTGDDHNNCVTIGGTSPGDKNTLTGSGSNGGFDVRLFQRFLTILAVPGYAGLNNDNAAMNSFLTARNTLSTISATNNTGAGGPGYSGTCTAPLASLRPFAADENATVETAKAAAPASGFSADRALTTALDKTPSGFGNSERGQVLGAGGEFGEQTNVETPKAAPAVAPVAAFSGETVSVNIGTLRAGDSVTITFQVTVASPFTGAQPQVSNQATVTADGGISVLSDDPSEPGAADATVTPLLLPPTINVNDSTVAEPASGSTNMLFTVTLSHAFTQTVTVSYNTANGGANPADATDYTTSGGTVTFNAGQTVQTVAVPVLADGTAAEGDEHFHVILSGASNGTIGDGQATGTITDESIASPVIISELRTNGPNGLTDDFVELLNTTDADITVASTDGSAGWALVKRGADCNDTPVVVGVIPNGTVIPARGNYLFTGSGYSLAAYAAGNGTTATGDALLTADIELDGNVALFTVANLANVSAVNRLDAVGFGTNTNGNCDLLREGNTLTPNAGFAVDYSFVRKVDKGQTQDTTDNAADFIVVDTNGTSIGGVQRLGAPGPENLSAPRGPVPCGAPSGSAKFGRDLIDPTVGAGVSPNVVRDLTSNPAQNSTFGTLDFRRTFTNNTGGAVTRLRFRITNLSTFPSASGTADLRARTSAAVVVTTGAGNKTVQGTTLEQPPSQPNGGGVNATLSAGTVTLATPIPSGASVNLRFLFGVQQTGDYDIGVVLESLPSASGKDFWRMTGHTENGGHTDGGCNKPPVANAGTDITAECVNGQASVTLDGSASTDPDGDTPLTYEWKEGATVLGTGQTLGVTLATGSHTITLKVTDPSGDSSTDTVAVNVVDTEDPVVTPPADVTVYTGPGASSCSAVVSDATLGTATAADACEGPLTPQRSGVPAGNVFPVGTTQVTYTATDAAGNVGSATQNVVVIDNTVPTVTPPANITANADPGSCSATLNPGTASGSDNCSVQSINGVRSDSQALNAPYPVGTTTIAWTVTDASGNTASANQTVTVIDNQPPTVTSSVAVTTMGPPHNHALINVGLSATASDNCGTVGPLEIFVYSDEDDGLAPHSPDAVDIGLGTLKLRRERDGGSNGRVYLIVVKATDSSGNTSVSVTTVTVPLSNSAGDIASVNAQAAAAASYASSNGGNPPAGYFVVGP
jgi:uncharacterized repeat protein (TIGR01451 family)